LFSSHPKRERDREAHLNYYASAYNRGRQLSHHKTKLNQIQQKNKHASLTKKYITQNQHKKLNPGWIASSNSGLETVWNYLGRKGRDGQSKKTDKVNKKRKKGKVKTRMWANAQRNGRPAKYRWRPLFNAAKFA